LTTERLWAKIFASGDARNSSANGAPAAERHREKSPLMAGHREDFILMMVGGITLDPSTKMPIVVLKDPDNKLNLPIWIGPLEATAMATELEGVKAQRPLTHDLLRNLLTEFGATVESVEVTELRESTYFARIQIKTREGKALELDSRPSDAIALALRTKSPIYVAKKVLEDSSELHEKQGEQQQTSDQNLAGVSRDKWSEILERMSPEDFKYKM
jgi:bifunctional DNase/RNase